MWITPIFDRTSEDVLKVQSYETIGYKYLTDEQKNEWISGLKGAFNYKDMNRIENNIKFLANLYGIKGVNVKTNWGYSDIASLQDIQRIIRNVDKLRDYFDVLNDTPKTPEIPINTYQKLNDLEKILYDMYYTYENQTKAFSRNDEDFKSELYSGDEIAEI